MDARLLDNSLDHICLRDQFRFHDVGAYQQSKDLLDVEKAQVKGEKDFEEATRRRHGAELEETQCTLLDT